MKFVFVKLVMAIALVTLFVSVASAQEKDEPRPKATKSRVALLEQQVDEVKKEISDIIGSEAPNHMRERLTELQGKLEELNKQITEIEAASKQQQEAKKESDAKLDELSEDVKKLWEENEALKKTVDENLKKRNAGYDKGFFLRSDDEKFELRIGGFVKPYYRLTLQEDWEKDGYGNLVHDENGDTVGGDMEAQKNEFGLAAGRISISAKVFGMVHGKFELDFGNLSGSVSYPKNADITSDADYNKVGISTYSMRYLGAYGDFKPISEFGVRAGQFKVPFDRETLVGTSSLMFTGRSLMTRSYPMWGELLGENGEEQLTYHYAYDTQRGSSFGYDRGVQVMGCVADGMFNYAGGIFNGAGINQGNDNSKVLMAARLWTDPLGKMTSSMSDLDTSKSPLLSVGAGFVYDTPEHHHPLWADESSWDYYSESINITGDALFKWYGVAAMASVFFRTEDHGNSAFAESRIKTMGMTGQLAYYIDAVGLEPAFRYSMFDADLDREGDNVHEVTGAVNYYVFGQNFKVQLEYRGLFPNDMSRSYLAPVAETELTRTWFDFQHEITLMAQLGF